MNTTASNHIIAIDGPAAAGKSTVARTLADELGALLFDTGALYRAVTLLALRASIPAADGAALAALANASEISVRPPSVDDGRQYDVLLDGEDVTWQLRAAAVDSMVSPVATHPDVRNALLSVQRDIARQGKVVMVGRDIGTVVVPDASVKVLLVASPEERARRRSQELLDRGVPGRFEDVLAEIASRDDVDSGRDVAPLRPAADAIVVATDGLSVPEVVAQIRAIVDRAWARTAAR